MSDKYFLLMYYVHSYFETVRDELTINENTTVENFQKHEKNKNHCDLIQKHAGTQFLYDLSYNQLANGIILFINSWRKNNGFPKLTQL